ncbi:MAG: methyltransferase domain-containing protein [Acidimicrobiales bacterium]
MTPRRGRVAVIGAGVAPLVAVLAGDGFAITAIDISAKAIALLADQLADLRGIDYVVADARSVQLDHRVATWHDRAVFHFLTPPADQLAHVARATATVQPHGHLVLATFAPNGPTECSGLRVARHSVDSLQALFGATFDVVDSFEADHQTPSGGHQQFTYCTFRRSARPHP